MTTTANDYAKSMKQYEVIANYASEVFNKMTTESGDYYEKPLTAKQVCAKMKKGSIWNDYAKEKENGTPRHNIPQELTAEGLTLTTTPAKAFEVCESFENILKIKPADRRKFFHAYECEDDEVIISVTLPAAKAFARNCSEDEQRPVMCGVYIDVEEGKAIASDGHTLSAIPVSVKVWKEGESMDGGIIPAAFAAAHAGEEVKMTRKYIYCNGQRAEQISGRFPIWRKVVPEQTTQPIHIGSAWAELSTAVATLGALDEAKEKNRVMVCGKKGENELTVSQLYCVVGIQTKRVKIDGVIPYDFALTIKGDYINRFDSMQDIYLTDCESAALYTDGENIGVQMPMMMAYFSAKDNSWTFAEGVEEYLQTVGIAHDWKSKSQKKQRTEAAPIATPSAAPAPTQAEEATASVSDGSTVGNPEPVCEEAPEPAAAPSAATPTQAEDLTAAATAATTEGNTVTLEKYTEKSFILKGATMAYRRALTKYGTWYKKLGGWILSNKRRAYVEKLIGANLVTLTAA